jgi:2-keto-4-pentenoate hydratase/2-oxohepta-3-ene-1,7-dioic acid hydratase in catechol pathway
MRLLNFFHEDRDIRLGSVQGERVLDLSAALQRPEFRQLSALMRAGEEALKVVREYSARNLIVEKSLPLTSLRHAPLLDSAARIFAVGLNYADHAAENDLSPPESPIIFSKLPSNITPHEQPISLPSISHQVDYEAELAFVLGTSASRVTEAEAADCIAGYTIMNDVTARDLQIQDGQWFRGKNCDGFSAIGPWLVTADEIPHPGNLDITLRLNGHSKQHSNSRHLFFKPAKLVSFLSQTLTLAPGDAFTTGTPSGIGYHQKPQVFLKHGDVVEVEVDGIGVLRNYFVRDRGGADG